MASIPLLPDSPAKIRWIARCAIRLRENKPELTKEEALEFADEVWLAAHLSLTPEHAADTATGHSNPPD